MTTGGGEMRRQFAGLLRPLWVLVGLLVAYFAFPAEWTDQYPLTFALSLLGTVGSLALVGTIMVKELSYVRQGLAGRGARALSILLVFLVVGSSLAFFLVDQARPREVIGLETRIDALYFTLSTMTTVGFGDVHAEGQIARTMVCVLIVFNVVVVASLIRFFAVPSRPGPDSP